MSYRPDPTIGGGYDRPSGRTGPRQPSGSTMSGYHLRSRAGGLLASGSNYLASRDWQGMASSVRQKVSDAGQYASQRQQDWTETASRQRASDQRGFSTSTAASNPAFRATQSNQSFSSLKSAKPGQESPVLLQGWAQRNVARDRYPQAWSSRDAPEDLDDGEVELQVSIDGFVAKTLDAPTRGQRLFNQVARQLAGLPRLPAGPVESQLWDSSATMTEEPADISDQQQSQQQSPSPQSPSGQAEEGEGEGSFRDRAIRKLMEGADEETLVKLLENLGAFPTEVSSAEAASKLEGRTLHGRHAERDSTLGPEPRRSPGGLEVPHSSQKLGRRSTSSSLSSSSTTTSLGGSLYWADRTSEELHKLHANLSERLRSYWIYRSGHKDVQVEISPLARGQVMRDDQGDRLLLATTRLTTDSTGQFSHRLVIPWHMLSGFCSVHFARHGIRPHEIEGVEVRAVLPASKHLLRPAAAVAENDNATSWLRHPLTVDSGCHVRVISDIDDTVKHTGVLLGTKRILRNVFVLPFEEVEVAGVAQWYQAMVSRGVGLHYVTNAPLELHGLVSEFFRAVQLPTGHLTLKHYPSGTRNLLASWMEPAGERKRANVVKILDEFPQSRFILVGDSGELDLELYTALAAERPTQVRGIFIRDVSSPRPGLARSPTTSLGASPAASAAGVSSTGPAAATAPSGTATRRMDGRTARQMEEATSSALKSAETVSKPPVAALSSSATLPPRPEAEEPAFFQPSYPPPPPLPSRPIDSNPPGTFPPKLVVNTGAGMGMGTASYSGMGGLTDSDVKRKQAFQSRLLRATSLVPPTTVFRLFYEGRDVEDEALRLVEELQAGK